MVINHISGYTSPVDHCIDQQLLVCPHPPMYYKPLPHLSCASAIILNSNVYKSCNAHVKARLNNELVMVCINMITSYLVVELC